MAYNPLPPLLRRWLAGGLAVLIGLGPLATPADAAGLIPLADGPLNVKNSAKPNIVLTVDDSTSMLSDFLPDYVVDTGTFCRDQFGVMNAACGFGGAPIDAGSGGKYVSPQYIWEQYGFPYPAYGGSGYDTSGPGVGCDLLSVPPTCSGGISPGPLPGIATYPVNSGSPSAGKAYEYWLLWPAPAHNSALNAVYYDPRLTYDPPVDATGASYPNLDAGATSNWTAVPADPWAPTITNVDLTATVTVGQWCNSDWTQGNDDSGTPFVTNPGHCRANGLIAPASAGSPAATGDYMYPWVPPGITPNDFGNTKVDWSTVKTTPPTNATIKPAWALAQDPKYFYQNENVLWCDITSPDWPQTGPTVPQTCQNINNGQVCNPNATQPTCTGAVSGVCGGGSGSGACNNYFAQGNCNGFVQGVCGGNQLGVCNGQVGVCTAPGGGTCSVIASCTGGTAAACNGSSNEACVGGSPAACNNIQPQACNGASQTTCNPVAQTCNGAQTQTCVNIVSHPPDPSTCTSAWDPPDCNLNPDPEGSCVYKTTCPPPQVYGNCSVQTGTQCTQDSQCPAISGTCSIAGNSCQTNADCSLKRCAGSPSGSCNSNSDCPATGGTCARDGTACTVTNGVSSCQPAGTCNNPPNSICYSNPGSCPSISAHCQTTTGTSCATSANCPVIPNSGTCNNPPNAACTSAASCPAIGPHCSNASATSCANPATDCPASGTCSNNPAANCNANAQCPAVGGKTCTNSQKLGQACNVNTDCDFVGTCQNSLAPPATACTTNAQCNVVGHCTAGQPNTTVCTVDGNNATCNVNGSCSTGNVGAACTANGSTAQCAKNGTCSNNGVSCTTANQGIACAGTAGTCTQGLVGQSCPFGNNAACDKNAVCGQSQNNGASCSSVAQCTPLAGSCSVTGDACNVANDCPKTGTCSITGVVCTAANAAQVCTSQPGALDPRNARCDTTGVSGDALTTLLADANGPGKTCRRNNHAYPGVSAAQFNYPSGNFTTPVTGEITPGSGLGCSATNRYANIPRHYWKTEVQWCDQKINPVANAPTDEWVGFGTDVGGGSCQAGKDSTHVYPRFFQFGAASFVDNYTTPAFQRVDLDITNPTATYTHTWIDASGQTQMVTRTFAQEMTNYANWFAYYRTRIQAVKTVTALSFTALDDQYRVGFHTLSNGLTTKQAQFDPATFVDIQDFDATQKSAWFTQLFGIQIPLGLETPTLDAMARIGDYFLNGSSPKLSGSTDPITLSCQKNYHMLFTDGFTNQGKAASSVGDQDDQVPALPEPVAGLASGTPWPAPFRENSGQLLGDAASDYAMKYWVTDLRTAGAFAPDNVPGTSKDPATWQHLNFAALSLGTQGKLPTASQSVTEQQLSAGSLQWPIITPNCGVCTVANQPDNSGVDDLWHAAINGHGRFVNAGSAAELKLGMGQILQDITNQAGSRSGVGVAGSSISSANHAVYRVTFQPGWAGTVSKIDIDLVTGAEKTPPVWEAAEQLSNQLKITDPTCATSGSCPWFENRKIFTVDDTGTAVPFLWDNLSPAQQDSLAPGLPAVGQAVLEYLRGNPTNEGVSLGQFRVRATATFPDGTSGENFLGDIVDSSAVYVGPPNAPYIDANDPGYSSFVAGHSSRPARVYVGANDGMLHAFWDADDSGGAKGGDEAWAFIPRDLYRPDNTGLGALAYQDGALPPFRHHFYVDSTPRVIDVDLGAGSGDWHTLLVGGLGKGGKSYYALDVTNPAAVTDETTAAGQYMWTFTDADMGYTYGRPILAKTRAFGGKWLMVVTAGYNNPSGLGKIFFVDAATGKKLKELDTGFGSPTNPSGLAQISGYTQDFRNQLIDQIYGGDLYGNLWRFDVSDPDDTNWNAKVEKLAVLTDSAGVVQPVTTPPQIEVDLKNSTDRWVFIGTGRLLDDTDLSNATIADQQQTFYAIRDGTTTKPDPIDPLNPLTRADLVPLVTAAEKLSGLATKPVHGWFEDLPVGQRIVTPVQAIVSVVAYAGTSPQEDPCLTGQPATLYVRAFDTGESLLEDLGGNPVADLPVATGAVGLDVAIFTDSSGGGSASGVDIRVGVTAGTTGDVIFQHIKPPAFLSAHRMSWRLLGQ